MQLLCLSNGHGEDGIALRILQALQRQSQLDQFQLDQSQPAQFQPASPLQLAALPIVGEGHLYRKHGIPIIGPARALPSGGFIYMDNQQLLRDLRGGLLKLTLAQLKALRAWVRQDDQQKLILAVGDIVPLLFAWWSGASYAFVGTAKSEYYLRDEQGWLPRLTRFEQFERWAGSVYAPWERWLLSRPRCRAVFPRDHLTHQVLKRWPIPSFDLGNPMMDGLTEGLPEGLTNGSTAGLAESPNWPDWLATVKAGPGVEPEGTEVTNDTADRLTFVLLSGSRSPEAYENWSIIMQAVAALVMALGSQRQLLFLGAVAPQIEFEPLRQELESFGWRLRQADSTGGGGPRGHVAKGTRIGSIWGMDQGDARGVSQGVAPGVNQGLDQGANQGENQGKNQGETAGWLFEQYHGQLILTRAFKQCLHQADFALAMAGTATEQFVGLGKPALIFPGAGPQFTARFAEAQTRLLGPSVTLVEQPQRVVAAVTALLQDPDRLQLIRVNGMRRMGQGGSADRIAAHLIQELQRKR